MTQAGIEPATFRFVAQHVNHCDTAVPGTRSTFAICTQTYQRDQTKQHTCKTHAQHFVEKFQGTNADRGSVYSLTILYLHRALNKVTQSANQHMHTFIFYLLKLI